MSVTSRNKSAKWNIAEVICASLLNGPFTQTPHPFASSNTFWLWQQSGCFQLKQQIGNADEGGLPAHLWTHTPWNFLQKTLQLHCTAIASAGERSFHLYSPALPLLPHPSLCLLPSIPRSSSFTTQRSCSGVIPAGPRADHPFYFLLKKFGGPKGFLLTSIILPCHRNCVSSQFSPTRRLCTRSHSDDTATSPATWLTGDSPVPKTIHIYSSCL